MFHIIHYAISTSLRYQRITLTGYKDIELRKSEIITNEYALTHIDLGCINFLDWVDIDMCVKHDNYRDLMFNVKSLSISLTIVKFNH